MTPADARQKWCPMARVMNGSHDPAATYNRLEDFGGSPLLSSACDCIADDCAMWVWTGWKRDGTEADGRCGLINPETPA